MNPKIAYVFPGQGAQYSGMGKEFYQKSQEARRLFDRADDVLGFKITEVMFEGSDLDLKQTKVTQPAVFIHSYISAKLLSRTRPDMVAGHSLGEFTALAIAGALGFEDALALVLQRAEAMQRACEATHSTMAAVLGLPDEEVDRICRAVQGETVVAANFNCPGQVVISGTLAGVEAACEQAKAAGAKRALPLKVGGAFHSPLMESARGDLEHAIQKTSFEIPSCPVYQNVDGMPYTDPDKIRTNLVKQLTAPVLWTQSVQRMIADGAKRFVEYGPGKVLQALISKVDKEVMVVDGNEEMTL